MLDEMSLAVLNLVGNLLTAVSTLAGLIFVWRQVVQARESLAQLEQNRVAELQPYVSAILLNTQVRGEPAVVIQITNHGRTPALNLRLHFAEGQIWHYVSKPNFPFIAMEGISALAPGETRTYFLGRLVPETDFYRAMQTPVALELTFMSSVNHGQVRQGLILGLNDGAYSLKVNEDKTVVG